MSQVYQIVIWLSVAVVVYGIFAAALAVRMLIKHRDAQYRELYEQYLQRKTRVEKTLRRSPE